MEDIRIYDYEFNLLHIEHDISSCNWTFYENAVGTFEMHFPLTSRLVSVAMEHRYLVAVQGRKQAVITGRQLDTEGVLYGRSCNWLLSRFCVSETFDTDALFDAGTIAARDAQTVCRYIFGLAMDGLMVFEMDADSSFGDVYVENKTVTPVLDLVQGCLTKDGAGHEVLFDVANKRWVFRMTKGKTLSVILSEDNRNAYEAAYTEDMQDYFTGGWYEQAMEDMGEWDAANNSPYLANNLPANFARAYRVSAAGTRFGITFAEGEYIVCRDKAGVWEKAEKAEAFLVHIPSALSGLYAWESSLDGASEDEAAQALRKKRIEQALTAKVRGLTYGKDYALGDSVRAEIKKGTFKQGLLKKITGVNLWYESNDIGEEPIMEEAEL